MPEVPRLTVTMPGLVFPVPMAAIMLSLLPALTTTSSPNPSLWATSPLSFPVASSEGRRGGSFSMSPVSMASTTSSDQSLLLMSMSAVPEASPYSIEAAPVR